MTAARYDWSPLRAGDTHSVVFTFVATDDTEVTLAGDYEADIRSDWYPAGSTVATPTLGVDEATITLVLDSTQTAELGSLRLSRFPFTVRDTSVETTLIEGYVTVRTQGGTAPAGVAVTVQTEPVIQIISPAVPVGSAGPAGADGDVGEPGESGIVLSDTAPEDTDVLWADTATEGVGVSQTVSVFTYTDETDERPDATVVFWIPDPYTLANPVGAEVGDLVLRTTPDVITSVTGVTNVEHYTVTEYDAIVTPDPDTVYIVVADP